MEILIKDDPDIAKAHKDYRTFTEDDEIRELHDAGEKLSKNYNY